MRTEVPAGWQLTFDEDLGPDTRASRRYEVRLFNRIKQYSISASGPRRALALDDAIRMAENYDRRSAAPQFARTEIAQLGLPRKYSPTIDMVLFCPACGTQHIDKAKPCDMSVGCNDVGKCYAVAGGEPEACTAWDNPPHRSHLCHNCNHIWRPADVPTNGVAAVKTKGKNDSPIPEDRVVTCNACGTAQPLRCMQNSVINKE